MWQTADAQSADGEPSQPDLHIKPLPSGLAFTWRVDPSAVTLSAIETKSGYASEITLADFENSGEPAKFILPQRSHLIVLPDGAIPDIQVEVLGTKQLELAHLPPTADIPAGVERADNGQMIGGGYEAAQPADPANLSQQRPVVGLQEVGKMGGVRLARVTFSPVVFDTATGEWHIVTHVKAEVAFGTAAIGRSSESGSLTKLQTSLLDQVVNPELIQPTQSEQGRAAEVVQIAPRPQMIIEVAQAGLYEITHAQINAINPSWLTVAPSRWQLAKHGVPVDMLWEGDGDDTFEANERFLFVAPPSANRWSTSEFYTLTAVSGAGGRIGAASKPSGGLPTGNLHVEKLYEQDISYTPNCFCGQLPLGRDGDRWIWDELRSPGNPSGSYPLNLPANEISSATGATLTLWMIGFTDLDKDNDHMVRASIDDFTLGTVVWDGKNGKSVTFNVPKSRLKATSEIRLNIVSGQNPIDGLWLDAFALTLTRSAGTVPAGQPLFFAGESAPRQYPLTLSQPGWVFDITDSHHPKLRGAAKNVTVKDQTSGTKSYLAADGSAVQQPTVRRAAVFSPPNASYLMIGPAEFEAGLAPLKALRQSQGWSVGFVSLAEIYDSYGYGYPSATAIRDAIKDGYQSASVKPEAVVLVGDGTYDPKQHDPHGKPTIIPVMYADVDPWIGEIPADNRFATVDGDDVLPDVYLGRLPVNNLDELKTVVGKLVAYPAQNLKWRENVTFVADDNDEAGAFSSFVSHQFSSLNNGLFNLGSVQYLGSESTLPQIKSQIGNRFQSGSGHMIYVGHSTVHQWADENFMHISEVDDLTNQTRLSVILQMTCFTGSFHMTGLDSFDEALLRHPNGGAAAVWGATGLSVTTGHDSLAEGYLEVLAAGKNRPMGEAILAGKINMLIKKPRHLDLIDAYTLLGDPALVLAQPPENGSEIFMPFVINQ